MAGQMTTAVRASLTEIKNELNSLRKVASTIRTVNFRKASQHSEKITELEKNSGSVL